MRKINEENKYYVYIWYVIEPYEIFYIGKGSGKRAKDVKKRNKYFLDMYSTHACDYHILVGGLPESVAFDLEKDLIKYVRKEYPDFRLTNICDGGEGASGWIADDEYREKMRQKNLGEGNPNYHNWWPDERKQRLSKKLKDSGERQGAKNANSKSVMCVETGEVFEYISLALKAYGIKDHSNMSAALKSPYHTAGGKHWVTGDTILELSNPESRAEYLSRYKRRNKHL